MSNEWTLYSVLQLVGVWAAAFATFYAARAALKIAKEQFKVHLVPSIETGFIFPPDGSKISVVDFSVSNAGFWGVSVTGFRLTYWGLKGKLFITGFDGSFGARMPCRIESAESKSFFAGKGQTHEQWVADVSSKMFSGTNRLKRWIILKTLRVIVQGGNGVDYFGKPGNAILKLFEARAKQEGR